MISFLIPWNAEAVTVNTGIPIEIIGIGKHHDGDVNTYHNTTSRGRNCKGIWWTTQSGVLYMYLSVS